MTTVESGRTDRTHEPLTDQFLGVELSVDDANALYADLRAKGRLLWNASQGFWVAPCHAEVMTVSTDPDTYCSGKGILTMEIGADYPSPPTMMHTDPPDHDRYRKLVQPGFRPTFMRALEESDLFRDPVLQEVKAAQVSNQRVNEFSLSIKIKRQAAPTGNAAKPGANKP